MRCDAYATETLDSAWLDGSGSVVGIGDVPLATDCFSRSSGSCDSPSAVDAMFVAVVSGGGECRGHMDTRNDEVQRRGLMRQV